LISTIKILISMNLLCQLPIFSWINKIIHIKFSNEPQEWKSQFICLNESKRSFPCWSFLWVREDQITIIYKPESLWEELQTFFEKKILLKFLKKIFFMNFLEKKWMRHFLIEREYWKVWKRLCLPKLKSSKGHFFRNFLLGVFNILVFDLSFSPDNIITLIIWSKI